MAELYEHIASKIRELRGGMSQEALAKELDIAANTLSRWETGTYKPSPEDLDSIARYFKVPITVFFPNSQQDNPLVAALASATGGLAKGDFDEVIRYAEFRKMRSLMEQSKNNRTRKK
ncbi:MAG: helix-turn-helix transcriptional regulator [Terracidiphilus sp.]|nr:helix-turn-helix transcriptional regulator [Terracidiphilus sp.]